MYLADRAVKGFTVIQTVALAELEGLREPNSYGNHNIWQMWLPGRDPISIARTPSYKALHHAGAAQMKFMRGLFEARPFWMLVPDQSLVANSSSEARAGRAKDGHFAVFYLPTGAARQVSRKRLTSESFVAYWFNLRHHSAQLIGTFAKRNTMTFSAPHSGRNNDWVLVLDDSSEDLPRLGDSYQNVTLQVR